MNRNNARHGARATEPEDNTAAPRSTPALQGTSQLSRTAHALEQEDVVPGPRSAPLLSDARQLVIFVDDDPLILRGVERLLSLDIAQPTLFFDDSQAALRLMGTRKPSIVVSDLEMPHVGGAELLKWVQLTYPDTVRILVSGQVADPRSLYRLVPYAHQHIMKPLEPTRLRNTLHDACQLSALLSNTKLRQIVSLSNALPTMPASFAELTEALRDPMVSISRVASIIERDLAMSARVLQFLSSAFFGVPGGATTVASAVSFLGLETIRALVLAAEFATAFDCRKVPGFSVATLQRRSFAAARLARTIALGTEFESAAFFAAMFHGTGQLILASRMPVEYAQVLSLAARGKEDLLSLEHKLLGATHAEVGAYLLALWGFPARVVRAIANYANPENDPFAHFDATAATHISSSLTLNPAAELEYAQPTRWGKLNANYLETIGVAAKLPRWRAVAQAISS